MNYKFHIIGCLSLLLAVSCNSVDMPEVTTSVMETKQELVSETYVFEGISYELFFDANDEQNQGQPLNADVAEELELKIQGKELSSLRYASNPSTIYLTEEKEPRGSDFSIEEDVKKKYPGIEIQDRAIALSLFEHGTQNGQLLCGECVGSFLSRGTNNCARAFVLSNLAQIPMSGGGNWNDKISSFTVAKNMLTADPNDRVVLQFYKDSGFPTAACKCEGWVVDIDPFNSKHLKDVYWCLFGGNLNDDITGFAITSCTPSCDNCYF